MTVNSTSNPYQNFAHPKWAWSWLAVLMGVAWILLYNPFLEIEAVFKFGAIGLILSSVLGLIGLFNTRALTRIPKLVLLLVFCLLIALIRMQASFDLFGDTTSENRLLMFLMIFLILSAYGLYEAVGFRKYFGGLMICLLLTAFYLLVNFQFVVSATFGAELGEFSVHSYQQISLVLGLAAIFVYTRGFENPRFKAMRWVCLALFLAMLTLVIFNRARGEFLALGVALIAVRFPRLSLVMAGLLLANLFFLADLMARSDLVLFNRIAALGQDTEFGGRSFLYIESVNLLWNEPFIALFGGGANYLQYYLNANVGAYPHNIFLEAWIIGGFLMFIVLVYVCLVPVFRGYSRLLQGKPINREAFAISIFVTLVFMKSGTLVSAWPLGFFLPAFAAIIPKKIIQQDYRPDIRNHIRL